MDREIQKFTRQTIEPVIKEVYCQLQVADDLPQEIRDKAQPSYITVYRWLKKYKQSEGNIHSLVSNVSKKGNRSSRLAPEVDKIIGQAIEEVYLNPNQSSIKDTYDHVISLIGEENQRRKYFNLTELKIPSYVTIRNAIEKIPLQKRDEAPG